MPGLGAGLLQGGSCKAGSCSLHLPKCSFPKAIFPDGSVIPCWLSPAHFIRQPCTSAPAPPEGDTDHEGLEGLDTADIICATPEKFDAVSRGGMRFFADIGLVLIGGPADCVVGCIKPRRLPALEGTWLPGRVQCHCAH